MLPIQNPEQMNKKRMLIFGYKLIPGENEEIKEQEHEKFTIVIVEEKKEKKLTDYFLLNEYFEWYKMEIMLPLFSPAIDRRPAKEIISEIKKPEAKKEKSEKWKPVKTNISF